MARRVSEPSQVERVEALESKIAPEPVNWTVWYSADAEPFPISLEDGEHARRFAYHDLEIAWYELQAEEAERTYDRKKYAGLIHVLMPHSGLYQTLEQGKEAIKMALGAGLLTEGEYRRELAEAEQFSLRHDLPKPVNLLEASP